MRAQPRSIEIPPASMIEPAVRDVPLYPWTPAGLQALLAHRDRWLSEAFRGDGDAFERRLADLRREAAAEIAARRELDAAAAGPPEASLGPAIWAHPDSAAVPFAPVLEPFVAAACDQLQRRLAVLPAETALRDLTLYLFRELSGVAHRSLYAAWEAFRHQSLGPDIDPWAAFVELTHHETTRDQFLAAHPVLARLIGSISRDWVEYCVELVQRWNADCAVLQARLGGELELASFVHCAPGLSDRHRGRTVAKLSLADGRELFYKPRSLAPDAAFQRYLESWSEAGFAGGPPVHFVLDCDSHGWAAPVQYSPPTGADALKQYYRNAGVLLFHAWLLGGSDFHLDNVIATATSPVLVDLECLLQPALEFDPQTTAAPVEISRILLERTSLLPESSPRQEYDRSGFFGIGGYVLKGAAMKYRHVNSAQMTGAAERATAPRAQNAPEEPFGRDVSAAEIEKGFEEAWAFAAAHPQELAAWCAPLRKLRTRFLVRPTNAYALLLRSSRMPEVARSEARFALEMERLAPPFYRRQHPHPLSTVLRPEREDLDRADVPVFSVDAGSLDLLAHKAVCIRNVFRRTGWEALEWRIAQLASAETVAALSRTIRRSLGVDLAAQHVTGSDDRAFRDALAAGDPTATARAIAQLVCKGADFLPNGTPLWLGLGRGGTAASEGSSFFLYDGLLGPALFLAAAGRLLGEERFLRMADAVRGGFRTLLEDPNTRGALGRQNRGAFAGMGSIILGMVALDTILGGDQGKEIALGVAYILGQDYARDTSELDILSGAAGYLAALTELWTATGQTAVLELASATREAIVQAAYAHGNEAPIWRGEAHCPLLGGFAHGSAGIAASVARFDQRTNRTDAVELLLEAIRHEKSVWRTRLAEDGETGRPAVHAWCAGTPSQALAMLDLAAYPPTASEARGFLAELLPVAFHLPPTTLDFLCCGNAGRLAVASSLSRASVAVSAQVLASAARDFLAWGSGNGGFHLDPTVSSAYPGFFRGITGIAYALLTTTARDPVPDLAAARALC